MRVVITGGHGFVGTFLARELLARGAFRGRPLARLVLADRTSAPAPDLMDHPSVESVAGDLRQTLPRLFAEPVDAVFHLASAVSAECERDLDLGLTSNLDVTRALLDAARSQREAGGPPVVLTFSSSLAVYGPDDALPLPEVVNEATLPLPQTSYGAQKLACEALIADYTRRGLLDGRVVRLMTVAVRPGRPNAAASSFVSGIIREPLAGLPSICPVSPDLLLAVASPGRTADGLIRVAEADRGQLAGRLPVNLPALTVTVAEMLDALRLVGGDAARELVTIRPDPAIEDIVRSWPARFDNRRAFALGLTVDPDIVSVVRAYSA